MINEEKTRLPVLRLSFGAQALLLLAVFLVISALLLEICAVSKTKSEKAAALTDGVTICRSAADVFLAEKDIEKTATLLNAQKKDSAYECYYDQSLLKTLTKAKDQKYRLLFSSEKNGQIESAVFTVYLYQSGEEIYSLSADAYTGREAA